MLSDFYKDLKAWIDEGCPTHPIFDHTTGLCSNLQYWQICKNLRPSLVELVNQFYGAGLDDIYPFNPASDYSLERRRGETYKNKARLKWVKDHAS